MMTDQQLALIVAALVIGAGIVKLIYSLLQHAGATPCRLCGKFGESRKLKHGSGYDYTYTYHPRCVREVLNNPERHGHKLVDIALDIQWCEQEAMKRWAETCERAKRAGGAL